MFCINYTNTYLWYVSSYTITSRGILKVTIYIRMSPELNCAYNIIRKYDSTFYIGIAMVILPYIVIFNGTNLAMGQMKMPLQYFLPHH